MVNREESVGAAIEVPYFGMLSASNPTKMTPPTPGLPHLSCDDHGKRQRLLFCILV